VTEGGNRSGRRERREAKRSGGGRVGRDSDSKRRVEHPAGHSAVDTAGETGHQVSVAVSATGAETRPHLAPLS
jgi:hypothetical protein